MATHGGIGVYLESGPVPADVRARRWRGVHHHYDGQPDGLGDELVARVVRSRGDLRGVVSEVIDGAPCGWISLSSNQRCDEEPFPVAPNDTGNTCYVYVFDVASRRLDAFATHSEASGEFIGSVTFGPDGTPSHSKFEVIEPPSKWLSSPVEEGWHASLAATASGEARARRADVFDRFTRDCGSAGLTATAVIDLVSHALSEAIFQAPWKTHEPLARVLIYGETLWRVRLGSLVVDYPARRFHSSVVRTTIEGGEYLTLCRPSGDPVEIDIRKSTVMRVYGADAPKVYDLLVSALPANDWVLAFFDLARSTQVPGSFDPPRPKPAASDEELAHTLASRQAFDARPPERPLWRVYRHADGRCWAIREGGKGYLLRLGEADDPVIKDRASSTPAEDIARLVAEQLADGFVRHPGEPA